MDDQKRRRRHRLVEEGGIEMFEVRIVHWFAPDGRAWTSAEVTTPDGCVPALHEVLGALQLATGSIMAMYTDE